jgi:hypothetical protein
MDAAILMLIASVLGGGVCGGLISALGVHRRTLALKTRMDAVEIHAELLKNQLLALIKRSAGEVGRGQRERNKEIEELAQSLLAKKNVQPANNYAPQWWESEVKGG